MKKVYSSDNLVMAGHVKSLLEADKINCFLKNQYLAGGKGDLPLNECWPEVWVANDEEHDKAMKIVASVIADEQQIKPSWLCECGETIEGQFFTCWRCGTDRPG